MDNEHVDAYLARIGVTERPPPSAAALRMLQERHLRAVPFENLSIHLGEPIDLDETALLDKIVGRHRGGFCYELNGAFAGLLRALGFEVTLLAARVFGSTGLGPLFDHLTLEVRTPEPWLVDVGFGRFSRFPLRLDTRAEQTDPQGLLQIVDVEDPMGAGDLDVLLDGEPQYRIESRPRELADFLPTCWYQQTHPNSHFATSLVCSMLDGSESDGHVTLSGRRLIRVVEGERHEQELGTDAEVLAAYRSHFGITLERLPVAPASPQA